MTNKENPELSIVLINYNTPDYLIACIESIVKETQKTKYEIIVVDNQADKDLQKRLERDYPHTRYLDMGYNSGFGRANNHGIRNSQGNYILVLNDDTLIVENALDKVVEFYKKQELEKKIGFLCCKLIGTDGLVQRASHNNYLGFNDLAFGNKLSPLFSLFSDKECMIKSDLTDLDRLHDAAWVSGAFLLFNSSLYHEDNLLFDEDFLIYTEDIDICRRAREKGYKNVYYPAAKIIHIQSASYSVERKSGQLIISQWLFHYKWNGFLGLMFLFANNLLTMLSSTLRDLPKQIKRNISIKEMEAIENRKWQFKLILKYGTIILTNFKRPASSSRNFLKFKA
ncbi:glycosyltransferase family 2 protein [Bacteroidota bacterium]